MESDTKADIMYWKHSEAPRICRECGESYIEEICPYCAFYYQNEEDYELAKLEQEINQEDYDWFVDKTED